MSADVIDWTARVQRLDAIESRKAIRLAIITTAAECGGGVHIAKVRRNLPAGVIPEQVGATICALVRMGYLAGTGQYAPNGDLRAGNASKPAEIRRLVKPIPPEVLA